MLGMETHWRHEKKNGWKFKNNENNHVKANWLYTKIELWLWVKFMRVIEIDLICVILSTNNRNVSQTFFLVFLKREHFRLIEIQSETYYSL